MSADPPQDGWMPILALVECSGRWSWILGERSRKTDVRWFDSGPVWDSFEQAMQHGPPSQWTATRIVNTVRLTGRDAADGSEQRS